ncbi:MAG: hypothetical protein Q9225_000740 [Loekoesia sp. 1 TL-2023]
MGKSRIGELAATIASKTAEIEGTLTAEDLQSPSFDPDSPPELLFHPKIAPLRQQLLEATDELHTLMLGPVGVLTSSVGVHFEHNTLISVQAICRYGLATTVPLDSQGVTIAHMASASGLREQIVQRLVRHAAAYRIFQQSKTGLIVHTPASKMLATNFLMRQWVSMVTEEMWPAAAKECGYSRQYSVSAALTERPKGYNIAHQTERTIFEEIARDPLRAQRYADAMAWFNTGPGLEPSHVLDNYSWETIGPSTVVDVGGSYGSFSIALAERFPLLRCIVQDRADVVAEARRRVPSRLEGRISFVEHDFFTEQPVTDVDVFFLRWILHDWSDTHAIRILRSLIPALRPGTKVLVNEQIVPEPGVVSRYREKFICGMDIAMLEIHNGKERSRHDWAQLFENADRRFRLVGATQPLSSRLGLLEFDWDPHCSLSRI